MIFLLMFLSFLAQFLDAVVGLGYGTLLTPVLILLNFPSWEGIPAVIFSQIIAAPITSISFQIHGNADFRLSSEDSKITGVLSASGVIGVSLAIYVFYFVLSGYTFLLQIYVGITVLLVGLLVFSQLKWKFSWRKIVVLGSVAAANKSLSGGGYTPIAAGGQMLTGRTSTQSIGCTTISKAAVSITATVLYFVLGRLVFNLLFLNIAIPLTVGAVIAAPIASYFAKRTEGKRINRVAGIVIICLGIITLVKTLLIPPL